MGDATQMNSTISSGLTHPWRLSFKLVVDKEAKKVAVGDSNNDSVPGSRTLVQEASAVLVSSRSYWCDENGVLVEAILAAIRHNFTVRPIKIKKNNKHMQRWFRKT